MDHVWAKDGGPAYPTKDEDVHFKGMSVREWFVGQALGGMAYDECTDVEWIAERAVDIADATMRAMNFPGAKRKKKA